ncbi:MAG TPA: response regulator [Paucimonas sp.]|nr:response regulator [Paucimonas sp.]
MGKSKHHILIVEDEHKIARVLNVYLSQNGFTCMHVTDGQEAVRTVRAKYVDALILDVNLPTISGFDVCRSIRGFSSIPIIMLTARMDEIDRVLGLEIGADDYVCKPFSPREIGARLRSVLRRAEGCWAMVQGTDGFEIEEGAQRIRWNKKPLPLTPAEYRLLKLLVLHPRRVFERDVLLDAISYDFRDSHPRAIDSHIKNLRKKLGDVGIPGDAIKSVYGIGYRFEIKAAN